MVTLSMRVRRPSDLARGHRRPFPCLDGRVSFRVSVKRRALSRIHRPLPRSRRSPRPLFATRLSCPRSLYVRGIILGYKRYVDGPTAEPLPRVARRAHRERTKTRLVLRETRAAAATGTTDARLETRERRRGEMCSPDRETRFRRTRAVVSTRRGVPALFRPRASRVGGRLVEGCAAPRRILAKRTVGHLLSRSRGHSPPRPPCLSDPSAPA